MDFSIGSTELTAFRNPSKFGYPQIRRGRTDDSLSLVCYAPRFKEVLWTIWPAELAQLEYVLAFPGDVASGGGYQYAFETSPHVTIFTTRRLRKSGFDQVMERIRGDDAARKRSIHRGRRNALAHRGRILGGHQRRNCGFQFTILSTSSLRLRLIQAKGSLCV